jgi:Flp pilus assembly protein CpaB
MERIAQLVHEHRRLLAALFAGLAVLAGLSAVRPSDDLAPLLVARHDLASGHVVTAGDVHTVDVPPASRPRHRLVRDQAVGRRVAGPMRAGEPLTDVRVIRPGSLAGYDEDAVLTTVRVDPVEAAALATGDRVDVVAVDPGGEEPAEIVARDVEIVTVPGDESAESAGLGVVTTEEGALALASAGLAARLSVITTSS